MKESKHYIMPYPIIDEKETELLDKLKVRYERLTNPNIIAKVGGKVAEIIPSPIKDVGKAAKEEIAQQELFKSCMNMVAKGFGELEKQAARMTVSESMVVKKINSVTKNNEVTCIDEVCLSRGYVISKLVSSYKTQDMAVALAEGSATGIFGFWGLAPNLVLSTFIYYRAVQSVAMYYGYDIKNDPAELMIASDVFLNSLNPSSSGADDLCGIIGKVMVMAEITTVKQTVKKTWTDMAARGGASLLLTQMRALANKAAQKALENAGKTGLERSVFKEVFAQIGKKLTKEAIGKAVPVAGALIGGLFDLSLMNTIIEYADVFYCKRFLLEKEVRINMLMNDEE